MSTEPSIEAIRQDAHKAAEQNLPPSQACKHALGSVAGRLWMVEYAKQINRLYMRRRGRSDEDEDFAP